MSKETSNPSIAVVDDSSDDLEILTRCFLRSRLATACNFRPFTSGPKFLEFMLAVASGEEPMPDVVLLDINMPEMDGFETLRSLRSVSAFEEIPKVLFVSNTDRPEDLEQAVALDSRVVPKFGTIVEGIEFFDRLAA